MDSFALARTLWIHRIVVIPILCLTFIACTYVFFFAPRTYEASQTIALGTPSIPTSADLALHPELLKMNRDNPFLRSKDSSLLSRVVIAKISSSETAEQLETTGATSTYTVKPLNDNTAELIQISASASSAGEAEAAVTWLSRRFDTTIRAVQRINGADDEFLIRPIAVEGPGKATEVYFDRVRSVIGIGLAGLVFLFGSVSLSRFLSVVRLRAGSTVVDAKHTAEVDQDPDKARSRALKQIRSAVGRY